MAPRLQCLRVMQDVAQTTQYFRVAFSTTARGMADPPSAPPASRRLLDLDNRVHPSERVGLRLPKTPRTSNTPKIRAALNLTPDQRIMRDAIARRKGEERSGTPSAEEMVRKSYAADLTRQLKRRWEHGNIYAPKDISPEELSKWRGKTRNTYDCFDLLSMNPIDEYKNFSIMSEFMTPMGRIKGANQTGLRPVNQRKIAKAIRRSIGLGIMPSVHRHPEILMKNAKRSEEKEAMRTRPVVPGY